MKGLVTLAIITVLIIAGIRWMGQKVNEDPGLGLAVAFGNVNKDNGNIDIHLAIDHGLVAYDGPKVDLRGNVLWDQWIDEHFALVEDGGAQVPLRRWGSSPLLPEHKVGGLPDGALTATIQSGKAYKYNILRHTEDEPKLYRYSFTAPAAAQELKRPNFALVRSKGK